MKTAKIYPRLDLSFIDHPFRKLSISTYFCGCPRRCKGCHNPELQNYNNPDCIEVDYNQFFRQIYMKCKKFEEIEGLVLLGGEPLSYTEFLKRALSKIKILKIDIVLYTGYLFEQIDKELLYFIDFVIDGEYREDLKTNTFPASANQRVWQKVNNSWIDITSQFLS